MEEVKLVEMPVTLALPALHQILDAIEAGENPAKDFTVDLLNPEFSSKGTETGRLSSEHENLANTPHVTEVHQSSSVAGSTSIVDSLHPVHPSDSESLRTSNGTEVVDLVQPQMAGNVQETKVVNTASPVAKVPSLVETPPLKKARAPKKPAELLNLGEEDNVVKLEVIKEKPLCLGSYEAVTCVSGDVCPEHFEECSGGSK